METVSIKPQPGAQEGFLSSAADITIYGGAAGGGKSYALLLEPLRHVENGDFGAVILRRTTPEITANVGGLWAESEKLYAIVGGTPRFGYLDWRFPSGARIKFDHMEYEKDKHKYQGAQIPLICFDEITHFTEGQFWYMVSRNRSTCGVAPYIRGTCNPDASSWVRQFIAWWIDDRSGYAIPERSGKLRWFVRHGGELQWANSREELQGRFPELTPKSMTFIPATLEDNPALTTKDPGYLANLQSLPYVERERLLAGNWNVVDAEGAEWPPEYFKNIWCDEWPHDRQVTVVALDPSVGKMNKATATRQGDYSAFVAVAKGNDGIYYVDANIERRPIPQIVEDGIEFLQFIRPDAFGIENIGFQEAMRIMFEPQLERAKLTGIYPIHGDGESRLPKKLVRIRVGLSHLLKNGRIKLRRSPGSSLLLEQLMAFPIHKHDDGPDALEMAIRLAKELLDGLDPMEQDEVLVA
jgi:predicted phage terminase large subunit-like protein